MAETTGRAKRQKVDRAGRFSALERLKQLKGQKNKYAVSEVDNVYDTVDESEYSERVLSRQEDDWIEDDGGNGYVEDGREIFDDDEVDDSYAAGGSKDTSGRGQKRKAHVAAQPAAKGNIRNLIGAMPAKKKEEIKTSEDDILTELMSDLDGTTSAVIKPKPLSVRQSSYPHSSKREAQDYFRALSSTIKKLEVPLKQTPEHSKPKRDEEIENIIKKELCTKSNDTRTSIKPSPSKSWHISRELKEDPQSATQQIDEFNSQDLNFADIDFSNDGMGDIEIKSEPITQNSPVTQAVSNDVIEDDDLEIFTTQPKVKPLPLKPLATDAWAGQANGNEGITSAHVDTANLPLHTNEDGEKVLRMYWLDAWEDRFIKPGVVYLFGKVYVNPSNKQAGSVSCCVVVKNICRKLFLLPREYKLDEITLEEDREQPVSMLDVYQEFNSSLAPELGLKEFQSRKVTRNYAFDLPYIPAQSEYLEVKYSASHPAPPDGKKYLTFSHVFGANTSSLERLLLERKVKGPCWLEVRAPVAAGAKCSWCRLEATCDKPEQLSVLRGDGDLPPPPLVVATVNTFSHVFGANTSSLERLLLERKVKGPCWLEVRAPVAAGAKCSWCRLEATCDKPEQLSVLRGDGDLPPPPLVVATINMRTASDAKTKKTKIVMISCLVHNQFPINKPPPNPPFQQHFCVVTRCSEVWPLDFKQSLSQFKATKLTKCDTERELLNYFLVQFWKLDADLVVGHDMQGFQQDLLIGNVLDLNIPNWSRLGRLKRSVVPQRKFASKDAFLGRLVCDIKLSAMELIRSRSFDLDTLCQSVLKMVEGARVDVIPEELPRYYENSRDLLQLVSLTMQDASYVLKIMCELNVLPLALQITQIAGNIMSRTLMGGRSERNEFLLLHAFTEKDYIVPDKVYRKRVQEDRELEEGEDATNVSKKQAAKKKPAYSGGLVLEPKKGFYDKLVLLMDFNSLYPSIIQEYNVCFTTVKRADVGGAEDDIANLILPGPGAATGVLPTQIRKLVESRREVKKLMKAPDLSPDLYMQYNNRQMALKLTANSMYGCLGFTHSRFYAKPLAALVTLKGREILLDTKEIVQKLNYEVIYGDTDSLMINTNCLEYDQVFKIGNELKKEINKKYRQIELDIDGVFRYLLLLKKKKYAAVSMSKNKTGEFVYTQEHKGLDIVRRDWSQLAAESGKFILTQILSEQNADDRVESIQTHLIKLKEDLRDNKMPLSMLTITKQLTKNPNEYADKNGQPHVQVALRLNAKSGRRFKKGDIVPYIICEDGTQNPATQRAYHIEELKNSEFLKVDINYYLAHQLHPVISRICDPIEGMDAARVADCLGLDPAGYRRKAVKEAAASDAYEIENEQEKYRHCSPFTFECVACRSVNTVREMFVRSDKESVTFLERCQNAACKVRPLEYAASVQNQLSAALRRHNARYYEGWLACEDPACAGRTTRLPQTFMGGFPLCRLCEKGVMFREYSEKDLYLQLNSFSFMFDLAKQNTNKLRVSAAATSALQNLKETVEDWLSNSAYSIIRLSSLLRFFRPKEAGKVTSSAAPLNPAPPLLDVGPDTERIDAEMEMGTY